MSHRSPGQQQRRRRRKQLLAAVPCVPVAVRQPEQQAGGGAVQVRGTLRKAGPTRMRNGTPIIARPDTLTGVWLPGDRVTPRLRKLRGTKP